MAVSMLCFTFLVAFFAINQSLADPDSGQILSLIINDGHLTRVEKLGNDFKIPCSVVEPHDTEYELRWRMKDDNTITNTTDESYALGPLGWLKRSYLIFNDFQAAHAGNWTCEVWSVGEKKVVDHRSVDLLVEGQDHVSWEVQFENNVTEYHIKKGDSIRWTLVINNTEPTEDFKTDWYWPNKTIIRSPLNRTVQKFFDSRMRIVNFTLSNVTTDGNYTVKVSKNNEPAKSLTARVSFKSDASNTTSKPDVSTTKNSALSSGIRIESSLIALVVAWFACRSVAFGGTA